MTRQGNFFFIHLGKGIQVIHGPMCSPGTGHQGRPIVFGIHFLVMDRFIENICPGINHSQITPSYGYLHPTPVVPLTHKDRVGPGSGRKEYFQRQPGFSVFAKFEDHRLNLDFAFHSLFGDFPTQVFWRVGKGARKQVLHLLADDLSFGFPLSQRRYGSRVISFIDDQ